MSDSFTLTVDLSLAGGSHVKIPMKSFERQEDAETEYKELEEGLAGLLQTGTILAREPNGSKVEPMTVGQFVASLGIVKVGHSIFRVPIHGAVVLAARPNLITLQ
jgi:hypothetical protein